MSCGPGGIRTRTVSLKRRVPVQSGAGAVRVADEIALGADPLRDWSPPRLRGGVEITQQSFGPPNRAWPRRDPNPHPLAL